MYFTKSYFIINQNINIPLQMKDRENIQTQYVGGVFDRQVRIDQWQQSTLKKQAVLVLGIGGLGSTVVINLLRLGIGKLFMVDYDVVDIHNLNRQLLYSHADVGTPKVEAALKNCQFHNAGQTEIQTFNGNALTNWQKIVDFARRSTFVYNCIDWGDKFDMAVASLCIKLQIPLVMGGTFSTSMTIDYFPAKGRACYLCSQTLAAPPEMWDKVKPELIADLNDISFLPKNNNPIGRSSVVVCTMCGEFMASHFLNWLFLAQQKPYKASRIIFYHNTFEIVKFEIEMFKKCPYCSTPEDHAQYEKEQEVKKEEERKKKEQEANKVLTMATKAFEEAKKAMEAAEKAREEALKAMQMANKAMEQLNKSKISSPEKKPEVDAGESPSAKVEDAIQKQVVSENPLQQ